MFCNGWAWGFFFFFSQKHIDKIYHNFQNWIPELILHLVGYLNMKIFISTTKQTGVFSRNLLFFFLTLPSPQSQQIFSLHLLDFWPIWLKMVSKSSRDNSASNYGVNSEIWHITLYEPPLMISHRPFKESIAVCSSYFINISLWLIYTM